METQAGGAPPGTPLHPISRIREEQDLSERVRLLENAPLFSVLHPEDLRTLATRFHSVRYRRGEVVFREGEPAERLFVIGEGKVKLTISSAGGGELLIGVLGRGQIFGELAVIDRGPRAMNARAMEEALVYALNADLFWTILENRPALARRLLELMARRLRRADQTSQDLVFFDAPTRLARRILQLAEEHGEPVGEGAVRLTVRVTQEEMAQMIGVTRGSVNRLIASFAGRGWIDWNDGHPIVLSPESLMLRAR
ncbi:MAG: Crp/Fnr family transcriptional regulator [Actinobacteria bacterium]|nr:Crp/Fnr family transcriptional regulator [Actinomycetota bacterium]